MVWNSLYGIDSFYSVKISRTTYKAIWASYILGIDMDFLSFYSVIISTFM